MAGESLGGSSDRQLYLGHLGCQDLAEGIVATPPRAPNSSWYSAEWLRYQAPPAGTPAFL